MKTLVLLSTMLGMLVSIFPSVKGIAAQCNFKSDHGIITGVVYLDQDDMADSDLVITGRLDGGAGLADGPHGFHVHESGDLGDGCLQAGGHYNPEGNTHGAPTDSNRHAGDLGNVISNGGIVDLDISDNVATLRGENSIVGRALVFHEGEDDLGRGVGDKAEESKKTGNAGARVGCCKIELISSEEQVYVRDILYV